VWRGVVLAAASCADTREETTVPHKHLLFRSEAREKILRGATAITDAVRVTLGPRSRCVLIEKK